MKLKSLLLGSAAALALSTGAQAADPIAEFVSLGVCDAYGITGLTIESDDTCLLISGEVEYEFELGEGTDARGEGADGFYTSSTVDWELVFEATTQTDAGAAVAVIELLNEGDDDVNFGDAYVQFGDATVLSAGKKGSLFDRELVDDLFTIDDGDLPGGEAVTTGGHVIQVESLVADGFTVLASLEDLDTGFPDGGTAGLGVKYDNAGVTAELGVLLGEIFGAADEVNYYGKVTADLDAFAVNAGFLGDDDGYWIATVGAEATFDMFTLDTEAYFDEDGAWGVAGEAGFDATDTVAVYVGARYEEPVGSEFWTIYGGVEAGVTETITVSGEVGYVEDSDGPDYTYGETGVTYAPGGNFETSLELAADTTDDYRVTFNASKSF